MKNIISILLVIMLLASQLQAGAYKERDLKERVAEKLLMSGDYTDDQITEILGLPIFQSKVLWVSDDMETLILYEITEQGKAISTVLYGEAVK